MRSAFLASLSPTVIGALVAAILITCAFASFIIELRALRKAIGQTNARMESIREELNRPGKQKGRNDEQQPSKADLRSDLDSLRSSIGRVPGDTVKQVKVVLEEWSSQLESDRSWRGPSFNEPRERQEDGLAELLAIANRIVQQSSTTLEAFRQSIGSIASRIVPWTQSADGSPVAFIVEHRGAHYAVPNVVKPARLPKEWFNRSEFGINDEIHRIVSLPRLRPRGNDYEVQEAGVFGR
jgi:hypothetical protein